MSTTLLALEQLLSQNIGDNLEFDTTTNIAAATSIVSTTLQNYDGGQDGYFNDWWVYITEGNNSGALRQVSSGTTYATATGTLYVRGAAFTAETAAVTCRLHRFNRTNKVNALNRAMEQVPLYKPIEDTTLITGNLLPDASFEWWTSTSALKMYSKTTGTLLRTTTAGSTRGPLGTTSAKFTAGGGSDYFYISSDSYPALLDLMNHTVAFYCWAYPEVANNAYIQIYTLKADGTAQTLTSLTTCPAAKWTQLNLLSQQLNDDLVKLDVRFGVTTNGKYAYFDSAILMASRQSKYLLPYQFQTGTVASGRTGGTLSEVRLQQGSYSSPAGYDLAPNNWSEPLDFRVIDDGMYKWLDLHYDYSYPSQLKLKGYQPLESLSADTDTTYIEGERLNLIVAKAASILYRMEQGPVSSQDKGRYFNEIGLCENDYRRLSETYGMGRPATQIFTGW